MLAVVMLIIPLSGTARAIDEQTGAAESKAIATITNGIYSLQNPETLRYVDVDDGASTYQGAHLEQWDYDQEYTQKWFFTKITSGTYAGYYTIMNMASQLYMTVENSSSSNSADVILSDFTGASGQYWKLESTSNSRYKIIPACGETAGRVLSVNISFLGANTNGLNILSRTYQDNDSYKDEWYLNYTPINLNLITIYDPQTINSTAIYSNNLYYATQEILLNFGVNFIYSGWTANAGLTQDFSMCASKGNTGICDITCDITNNNEDQDLLTECSTKHHRSASRVMNLEKSENSYVCRLVGFAVCVYDNKERDHRQVNGMAQTNGMNCIISTQSDNVKRTIQHELSHILGARDNECTNGEYCVMSGRVGYWCTNCKYNIFHYNAIYSR